MSKSTGLARHILIVLSALTACSCSHLETATEERLSDPWWQSGQQALAERLRVKPNYRKAKNVILFIGDGMGVSTVTAGRIYDGQTRGEPGEENMLSFERFPYTALIKTYNSNAQVPDSAGTASAMMTGVKTRIGAISIWADQAIHECFGPQKNFPKTLMEIGEQAGLSTGIVTTDKVTYATPATAYAHGQSRLWQDDASMTKAYRNLGCMDFAQQLVDFPYGDGIDVVMGGGKESFLPNSEGGVRQDDQNLIQRWQEKHPGAHFIETAAQLQALDAADADTKVMGLFSAKRLISQQHKPEQQPSLAEMTSAAIHLLSKNSNGYFLMVENGLIDQGHHRTNAHEALSEVQALHQAVETALEKVDLNDTLVMVTADHSHAFNISGYSRRGNPILGLMKPILPSGYRTTKEGYALGLDNKPIATLSYGVGPRARASSEPLTAEAVLQPSHRQEALVPLAAGVHAGEDVALYARGPHAYLVGGVLEQHVIFHIIAEAFGWSKQLDAANSGTFESGTLD